MREFIRMEEEVKKLSPKIQYSIYILGFFFVTLILRLWYLQIYQGPNLRFYSENNRLKKQNIQAPRGLILSRNNKILVSNRLKYKLTLTPQYSKNFDEVSQALSQVIQISAAEIFEKIKKSQKENGSFFPLSLKRDLKLEQIYRLRLLKQTFPELNIKEYIVRFYPFKSLGAQLLGHLREISGSEFKILKDQYPDLKWGDSIGRGGLEEKWEKYLRGRDGVSFIEVNAHGLHAVTPLSDIWDLPQQESAPGHHLVLTLDVDIQKKAIKAMNRNDRVGPRKGAVVAMKTNGEILAWVSSPSFNPNLFSNILFQKNWQKLAADPSKPMLNKVIHSHYPPGSTIKPLIALAALQEEVIDEETLIHSPSRIRLGNRIFHDHSRIGYGDINVTSAIEQSSNTFFYQLGQKLGMDTMAFYISSFGLGKKTEIQLKGEIPGFIPNTRWKLKTFNEKWQGGEDLAHAIGQGYTLATPLQMAVAFNTLATGGKVVRPFVIQKIIDSENQILEEFSSMTLDDLAGDIDHKNFEIIRKSLIQVVHGEKGSARWWKLRHHKMAGKTGTSQVRSFNRKDLYQKCSKKDLKDRHHGWFVGFAPVDRPQITVAVLTENSCSGSNGSAPIARDVIQAYLDKYPISETLNAGSP